MRELKVCPNIITKAKGNVIEGVFAVHGNIDHGGDRGHLGMFKNATPDRVRFLWNHIYSDVPTAVVKDVKEIGRAQLPKQVLQMAPEATGGAIVVREYLKTTKAQEIKEAVLKGAVREMSYGYNVINHKNTSEGNGTVRELLEVDLIEVSDVIWGMNGATVAAKAGYRYKGGLYARSDSKSIAGLGSQLRKLELDILATGL